MLFFISCYIFYYILIIIFYILFIHIIILYLILLYIIKIINTYKRRVISTNLTQDKTIQVQYVLHPFTNQIKFSIFLFFNTLGSGCHLFENVEKPTPKRSSKAWPANLIFLQRCLDGSKVAKSHLLNPLKFQLSNNYLTTTFENISLLVIII